MEQSKPVNVVDLYHAGDLGDTVYAIPSLRRLANPAHLVLYPNPGSTRVLMDQNNANMLIPLINVQRGITAEWKPTFGSEGLRLDFGVRRFYRNGMNLADIHSNWVGHDHWNREFPWFVVDHLSSYNFKIVVARSARYRSNRVNWKGLYEQFKGRACFVGVPWEHENFEAEVGKIEYIQTPTLLEVARVIAGADIFIGNQSCPRAVAEALKVPVIVEVGNPDNTHFNRESAWYPYEGGDCAPDLDDHLLANYWCRAAARRALDRSIHSFEHLEALARLCREVRRISGDAAEVGVGNGGSASVIAWCLQKKMHLCDDYQKLSEVEKADTIRELGLFFRIYHHNFYSGAFPSSMSFKEKFSFVHIDTGTLQSIDRVVDWFLPKMSNGGIIAFSMFPNKSLENLLPKYGINHIDNTNLSYIKCPR